MATVTVLAPYSSSTAANYKAWAQSFGNAFTTFGWVAQSGHGEVVASGTGGSYAWTNVVATPGATQVQPVIAYTFKGAWVSGSTYVGSNTINAAGEVDLVTDGGLTYVHITATSSAATAPGADATNWAPFNYEIWKSNGSNSSSLPIYIRLVYVTTPTANAPGMHIGIGRGIDANGNLISPITSLSSSSPLFNSLFQPSTAANASTFQMNFSGDADNIRWYTWRDMVSSSASISVLCVDRSKSGTGADNDSYVAVYGCRVASGVNAAHCSCLLNANYGGIEIMRIFASWIGVMQLGGFTTSTVNFGSIPPFLVLPAIGYAANPLLGIIGLSRADTIDGQVISVWQYGASHNYLVGKNVTTGATLDGGSNLCPAILWE